MRTEEVTTKVCTKCGQEKPLEKFHRNAQCRDGRRPDCGSCNVKSAIASRERMQAEDPEGYRLHRRNITIKDRHQITQEEYNALLEAQGGGCAICGTSTPGMGHAHLSVDHDHACCPHERSCGKCIRGLLCGPCNNGLGRFRDDPERLRKAASYLERGGPH